MTLLYTVLILIPSVISTSVCGTTNQPSSPQPALPYCDIYKSNSCCTTNHIIQLQSQLIPYYTSTDITDECRIYTSTIMCATQCSSRYTDTHTLCTSMCNTWYNLCGSDMYTSNNINNMIIPCQSDDLLCLPLNTIIEHGISLCQYYNISNTHDTDTCIEYSNQTIHKIYNKLGRVTKSIHDVLNEQKQTSSTKYDFTMNDIHNGIRQQLMNYYQQSIYTVNKNAQFILHALDIPPQHIQYIKYISLIPIFYILLRTTQWCRHTLGISRTGTKHTYNNIDIDRLRAARLNKWQNNKKQT